VALPRGRGRLFLNTSRLLAGLGLLAYAAHTGLGLGGAGADGFFNDWVYNALVLTAAGWCIARAVIVRDARPAWALLGLGLLFWATAEILSSVYLAGLAEPPYPSVADGFWLAFYPAAYTATVLLVRDRVEHFRRSLWMDGVVAGLAVAAVGTIIVFEPIMDATGGQTLAVATDLAYPAADLVMLALVIGVFALTGWRPGRAWAFIGAGLIAMAAADAIYAIQSSRGAYVEGTIVDALWPAATLMVGWAAWVPSRQPRRLQLHGWRPLVLPTSFAMLAVGVLVYDHFARVSTVAVTLSAATMVAVLVRTGMTFGENLRMLDHSQREALTDALTGLGNRRSLMGDLQAILGGYATGQPRALILFDLDGFKHYNDSFGHPAGDALLARLGRRLEEAVRSYGRAYRLGGDEFCALVRAGADHVPAVIETAAAALVEHGSGFQVAASYGCVLLPEETTELAAAMQIADQRLYGSKHQRRRSAVGQQTRAVLMQILHERAPDLHDRHHDVAELAIAVARRLPMLPEEVDVMARAAELHDVGKIAVPDQILGKAGPLDEGELDFIRQHTLVGERILAAAPALQPVARIVRTSHERWDGSGYPDGLAGEQIPLGARVIAVCDAYHAMTSDRVYQSPMTTAEALAELRSCAGTHFDPQVIEVFCQEMEAGRLPSPAADRPGPPVESLPEPLPTALRDPAAEPVS
jgi:diguanylate cyclase (GGDEF)-like protein